MSVSDPTSKNLAGLQVDVRDAAIVLVNAYRNAGYPAIITSGRRTVGHQRELIARGQTQAVKSRHLTGRAIDLGFLGIAHPPLEWFRLGAGLWVSMGGRWGGTFQNPDYIHFDG